MAATVAKVYEQPARRVEDEVLEMLLKDDNHRSASLPPSQVRHVRWTRISNVDQYGGAQPIKSAYFPRVSTCQPGAGHVRHLALSRYLTLPGR